MPHTCADILSGKHPKAFKLWPPPVTPLLDLVNYLTSKGYTFGEPVYTGRQAMRKAKVMTEPLEGVW